MANGNTQHHVTGVVRNAITK